eukprot:4075752-Prymnesium_polylepis.2
MKRGCSAAAAHADTHAQAKSPRQPYRLGPAPWCERSAGSARRSRADAALPDGTALGSSPRPGRRHPAPARAALHVFVWWRTTCPGS